MQVPSFAEPAELDQAPDEWALAEFLRSLARASTPRAVWTRSVSFQLEPSSEPVTVRFDSAGGA